MLSFFLSKQNGQNCLKQNNNQGYHESNTDDNSTVSNCTGTVIDLTDIDGQYEGNDDCSFKKNSTIERRNKEKVGVSEGSDVANRLFSSDFQSPSYDATDIPLKKV